MKNIHQDIDLASVPELQQALAQGKQQTRNVKRAVDEADSQNLRVSPSRKRRRDRTPESDGSVGQESSEVELKRLRKLIEDMAEEKQQTAEKHERELEDMKTEKRRLWEMVENLMKRTRE
jgi:hypothetical protein